MMYHRNCLMAAVLLLSWSGLASAQQEEKSKAGETETQTQADPLKDKLDEIDKIQDKAERRTRLDAYLAENPDTPHTDRARSMLLSTLYEDEPARAIEIANQLLATPEIPDNRSARRNAYLYKFLAYQTQKDEEAIRKFGAEILESQTDPAILQRAAGFDRHNAVQLYEKALVEREKDPAADTFPTVADLLSGYARALSSTGQKQQAVEKMLQAIEEISQKISEVQALPENDPKRRNLRHLGNQLPYHHQTLAGWLGDIGRAEDGLKHLASAEALLPEGKIESKAGVEDARAKLYERMAVSSHVLSFSYLMSDKKRKAIIELSERTGLSAKELFAKARDMRIQRSQAFLPFELKSVEGEDKSFESLKGKVTLVNFFFPT